MNNFGVFEIASAKTTLAPGWAYVPDTGPHPSTIQPTNRKRARNAPTGPSISDLTARQEARIRKEVEALERDGNRDNTIPIPVKAGRKGMSSPSSQGFLHVSRAFIFEHSGLKELWALLTGWISVKQVREKLPV